MNGLPMNPIDSGTKTTWWQIYPSNNDYRDMAWDDLLNIARLHWNYVQAQEPRERAYTAKTNSCLVAALMLPSTSGAVIFLSTIARGAQYDKMRDYGGYDAPAWYMANEESAELHAEKAAEYLFETSQYSRGIVHNGQYRPGDRDNPYSRMKLAVYGRKKDDPPAGKPIDICQGCRTVADRLNIEYWTAEKGSDADRAINDSFGHRGGREYQQLINKEKHQQLIDEERYQQLIDEKKHQQPINEEEHQ
ncbi:hypothetical protein Daus18300_012419 [Diaporthe australafricana]|uniref:Uncharacterized protein n=1 Tax=Diaporthe australafricana TaxID=127596 RepID=A0ABR3W2W8_9PEZI